MGHKSSQRRMAISFLAIMFALAFALQALSGCLPREDATQPVDAEDTTITVALYNDVTNGDHLRTTLQDAWSASHPDVQLVFETWNCYEGPAPDDADVLMYDSMFETNLIQTGHIQPFDNAEIEDEEGLFDWAVRGSRHEGKSFGIPMIVCSSFLVYHVDDPVLAQVNTLGDVPGDLWTPLLEMIPCYYLEAYADTWGYSTFDELPDIDDPDSASLAALRRLARACGEARVNASTWDQFVGAQQFAAGEGRAFFGFSENLRFMGDVIDQLDLRTISLAEAPGVATYSVDLVSVSAQVGGEERALCVELANLMCSSDVAVALGTCDGQAQYMLPARSDAYAILAQDHPLYSRLLALASDPSNCVLRAGTDIYDWTTQANEVLRPLVLAEFNPDGQVDSAGAETRTAVGSGAEAEAEAGTETEAGAGVGTRPEAAAHPDVAKAA